MMTEQEWLTWDDPGRMLQFLEGKASDRKLRLFAVACCRRIWPIMPDEAARNAVEVAERLAEGMTTNVDRRAAALAAVAIEGGRGIPALCAVASRAFHAAERASTNAAYRFAASRRLHLQGGINHSNYQAAFTQEFNKERVPQAAVLRCIVGNPFRSIHRSLLSQTVAKLARMIYNERAFDRLPILADALEESGCTNPEILQHCRTQGEHVRGCWVVDLVLGKE
jgi:hypothetical protein